MRRVGPFRVILVLVVVIVSFLSLSFQSFDISVFGSRFQRGNEDTILGMRMGLDLQGGVHLLARGHGRPHVNLRRHVEVRRLLGAAGRGAGHGLAKP